MEATASCRALQAPDKLLQHRVGSTSVPKFKVHSLHCPFGMAYTYTDTKHTKFSIGRYTGVGNMYQRGYPSHHDTEETSFTRARAHARTRTVIILCIHIGSVSVLQFFLMSCKYKESVQQNKMTWLASMKVYQCTH